jgi:hypothetical protein
MHLQEQEGQFTLEEITCSSALKGAQSRITNDVIQELNQSVEMDRSKEMLVCSRETPMSFHLFMKPETHQHHRSFNLMIGRTEDESRRRQHCFNRQIHPFQGFGIQHPISFRRAEFMVSEKESMIQGALLLVSGLPLT